MSLVLSDALTEFLLYTSPDGQIKVDVFLKNENVWLSQDKMAQLFDVQQPAIAKHIKNIFSTGELNEFSVHSILEYTARDGKNYKTKFYNLDMIIAVGYRVNSARATQFRIWSNQVIKDYIIKGYVMDVERMKDPTPVFGKDYFDEQLEKIRDIRSSERRFYQKITDIFAQCSIDYDSGSSMTKEFFATVQNKLHRAIAHQTAAEIVYHRVDKDKPHIGLTSRKYAPDGPIRKSDVTVAKNYLSEEELSQLNRFVSMYLDFAEDQAQRKIVMTMKDWIKRLDSFLQFNRYDILYDSGKVSHEVASALAEEVFEQYKQQQDANYVSDFDNFLAQFPV